MKPGDVYRVDYDCRRRPRHVGDERLYNRMYGSISEERAGIRFSCAKKHPLFPDHGPLLKQNDVVLVISFSVTKSDSRLFEALVLHNRTKLIGFVRLWKNELPGETSAFLKKVC